MIRIFTLVSALALVAGGAWYWSTWPSVPPTPRPALSSDLYPLYNPLKWSEPQFEKLLIGTTSYSGASITSAPVTNTMDPGSIFNPFDQYYDQKLKAVGWQVANDLAAGGHIGGQTGYRKGAALILIRFQINYYMRPENAPSECPCDVTLSLFSTSP